jgi:hypothetical protein
MARALPDSDRKFVSIFDIVDRKVWLAVGGVFRDATAPVVFVFEGAGVRDRRTCLRSAMRKVLSDRSIERKVQGLVSARDVSKASDQAR